MNQLAINADERSHAEGLGSARERDQVVQCEIAFIQLKLPAVQAGRGAPAEAINEGSLRPVHVEGSQVCSGETLTATMKPWFLFLAWLPRARIVRWCCWLPGALACRAPWAVTSRRGRFAGEQTQTESL